MRIVLAKTQADANAAKKALESGQSWATVAKKYSTDPTTKSRGGVLNGVNKSQEDAALSNAAFSAPVNKLDRPGQGAVRLLRIRSDEDHAGHAAVARARPRR